MTAMARRPLKIPSALVLTARYQVTFAAVVLLFCAAFAHGQAIITTIAGNGNSGFAGDGGQARDAVLNAPSDVLVDPTGNVYIADTGNNRVRMIGPSGVITT